jgi:uncharacterized protein
LKQLVENRWVRLAAIDPESGSVYVRRGRVFEMLSEPVERLPVAVTSAEWYRGKRQHLAMAWIHESGGRA